MRQEARDKSGVTALANTLIRCIEEIIIWPLQQQQSYTQEPQDRKGSDQ